MQSSLGCIEVKAGDLARDHSIVTFDFPAGAGKNLALRDPQGNQIPLQVGPADTKATFVLPSLGAGQSVVLTVEELAAAPPAGVTVAVQQEDRGTGPKDQLFVNVGGDRAFTWTLTDDNFRNRAESNVRAGYIYPLYTPGGLSVADDYAEDHPHMHGVWSAWTNTTFRGHKVDFWNGYNNQGIVDLSVDPARPATEGIWPGPVHGGLIANTDHVDYTTGQCCDAGDSSQNVIVMTERWVVTVYKTHDSPAPYFVFDIDSVQQAATTDELLLELYTYGGFAFRGAQEWQTASNVSYLTDQGYNRTTGDGQRGRWVAQYGNINGQTGGFAGLDHPTNFRHPQGLRIHPTNPYWAFVPCAAVVGGPFSIEPGTPYVSRYRVVSFDGAADSNLLNRLWNDFATPPQAAVVSCQ